MGNTKTTCIVVIMLVIILIIIILPATLVHFFSKTGGHQAEAEYSNFTGRRTTKLTWQKTTEQIHTIQELTPQVATQQASTQQEPTSQHPPHQEPWLNFRLPKTLIPFHYEVELKANLFSAIDSSDLNWFSGNSSVSFTAIENTSYVVIHSYNLNYSDIKLHEARSGDEVSIYNSWLYAPNQFLVVAVTEQLNTMSNYTLQTNFIGELANDTTGFYRTRYFNANNNPINIAASQMAVANARETFPCFDEPNFKATFDITLWHDASYIALSNMDVETVQDMPEGVKRTKFKLSPPMSTYLVAMVICDFDDFAEANTSSFPVINTRVYARPQAISAGKAAYSNSITPKMLKFFTDFFGINYPLSKLDQIAVPNYDIAGAMENWGLIVYKEAFLLFDESSNTIFSKQQGAKIIAHELSHQWFGNIISPLWWNEIWLNEGFANYMMYVGVNRVEPSWQILDQFVVNELHRAMSVDALNTSRPIVAQNVDSIAKIYDLFDFITYAKGACIVRMIRKVTGDDAFQLGLKNYLTANAYGSVTHNQIFQFWEDAINQTRQSFPPGGLVETMNTWVLQMGFPTVNVKRHPTKLHTVTVTQQRFLLDSNSDPMKPKSQYGYKWTIPFWYVTQSDKDVN